MTTTTTARDLRERLAAAGADEAVVDAVLRLTAPARHRARVIDTMRAALLQATTDELADELVKVVMAGEPVRAVHGLGELDAEESLGVAWAIITLDLGGRGGRAGVEGTDDGMPMSTARMPWARNLGKGRWFASDGGAYRAAASEARYLIERALGGQQPALEAIAEPHPALAVRVGGRDIARLPVAHMPCFQGDAAAWVYAHAVRQLAAATDDDSDDAVHNWAVVANTVRVQA